MNFVLKSTILFICLVNFIHCDDDDGPEKVDVVLQYKSNVTLDCSKFEDAEYYLKKNDENETKLEVGENHVIASEKGITIKDLRGEQIKESTYYCKKGNRVVVTFNKKVAPYILKPEKPSQTVTEGGNVELKCGVLYGNEEGSTFTWRWLKNGTEIANDDKYKVVTEGNTTALTISRVQNEDRGEFQCELKNEFGEHVETIQVRVKDALAALWPFLAIVAEVIILCLIILIYEKKCSKKPSANEEENEQAQNLMGKEGSELKKRTTKA